VLSSRALHSLALPWSSTNLYRVVDAEGYLDGVAQTLRVIGVCAQRDPQDPVHERILAKSSNESSEAYDVLTSDGYIRRGSGSFVDLCRPASFPIQRAPETPPPDSGCHAPYPPVPALGPGRGALRRRGRKRRVVHRVSGR
jgi:hypothetical protein